MALWKWAPFRAVGLAGLLASCSAAEELLSPLDVAGAYSLVSIYGQPLPAESLPGRLTVNSGLLEPNAGGEMKLDTFGFECAPGFCGPFHNATERTVDAIRQEPPRHVLFDGGN